MDLSRFRKITIITVFLLGCAFMAYYQVLGNSIKVLENSGYDQELIYLILTIPFITLLISFFRTIIGISINTIYIPVIIILTALAIGLNFTLLILVLCLLLAILIKYLITDFHFHFGSKLSLIISLVSIGLILTFPLLYSLTDNTNLALISYSALILSVINEKFFNYKITKNTILSDFKQVIKTILICVICYFLLGGPSPIANLPLYFPYFKNLLLNYPDLILISLILNIIIGQYTGLRLDEVIRFRKLIFK